MTKTKAHILSLSMLVFQACLFYLWQFQGLEQAGNVLCGMVITLAIFACIAAGGFFSSEDQVDEHPTVGWTWFVAAMVLKMVALLWAGAFWTYGIYTLGAMLMACRRLENDKRLKAREKAQQATSAAFNWQREE